MTAAPQSHANRSSQATPLPTRRADLLARLQAIGRVDLLVVGGGATGLSVALDAAVRGYSVVLVEAHDFAEGTSSRATKLLHGGVRYLAQGNVSLVREALRERTILMRNAPHLAQPLPFVMPAYRCWERPFYGTGLKLYDALAGEASIEATTGLDRAATLSALPGLRADGLRGGVRFWDGQFDDARLALAIGRTAAEHGALLLNQMSVTALISEGGRVSGATCTDAISGQSHRIDAACVVNATGVWVDGLRALDADGAGRHSTPIVTPSQGVHLVFDRADLPIGQALLVPRTSDGRVLFAVPWLGSILLGTTDTPRELISLEPRPLSGEIDFLLAEASRYFSRPLTREAVRSAWVGLRPLVGAGSDGQGATRRISREHTVLVSPSGLVSVTGGKWTTCRAMAEDVLACATDAGLLAQRAGGGTEHLRLVGGRGSGVFRSLTEAPGAHLYGDEAACLASLPGAQRLIAPGLSEAMVRFAVRHEYALSVADVLARRSRLLFLDARQALAAAPAVACLVAEEAGIDPKLSEFEALARQYLSLPE